MFPGKQSKMKLISERAGNCPFYLTNHDNRENGKDAWMAEDDFWIRIER